MKDYNEYDHNEIEEIADKFINNEFVTEEEIEKWYAYKQAVNRKISECEEAQSMFGENSQIYRKITAEKKEAENELKWIKTIHTYDLHKVCEFITYWDTSNGNRNGRNLSYILAEKICKGEISETEIEFVRQSFEESNTQFYIDIVRQLTTPVAQKHWYYTYNNATSYCPQQTPSDCTQLYNRKTHYIYIHSECEGRYGKSYWISDNCNNSLEALPTIKDFKEYDFQIGKFYAITCTDVIHFARNKKKYQMEIVEISEEEYMDKGFIEYAKKN